MSRPPPLETPLGARAPATGDGCTTGAADPAAPGPARWWDWSRLPGRWTPALLAVVGALLATSLALRVARIRLDVDVVGREVLERWFVVERELGVPAWLSTVLLFLCAVRLWQLADQDRAGGRRRWAPYGRLLAVVFVYLSLDEMTAVHEASIGPLHRTFELADALEFAWVLPAAPAVGLLGAVMLGWWRSLPPGARTCVAVSGALYVGGALGVELVGSWLSSTGGQDTVAYVVTSTVEEGLEMTGLVLFLGALHTLRRVLRTG